MPRLNLPRPARTVRRSVTVCQRMGYTRAQALAIIAGVCTGIMDNVPPGGDYDLAWLAEIREEALCRLQREMSGK